MLLAIDIGNTQTVLGLFEDEQLRHTWRLASDTARTSDELKAFVTQLFHETGKVFQQTLAIDAVVVASVVPALTKVWTELAESISYRSHGATILVVDSAITKKLNPNIDNPQEAGADRIANALAAKELYGAPAIVLDFGTATNIDVIDESGSYIGGIISPGLQTSADALFNSAARLPVLDLAPPPKVLGTTTKTAVQSGLVYGEAAKVDTLIRALQNERSMLNTSKLPIIATGGFASLIAPLISAVTHTDEQLTLKGLRLIAEKYTADPDSEVEESVHA